ncbi:hypothetical protein WJX72_009340 [[Myrmecia] bisecta]|uniref:Uncharacterized protein n=1 Tax=[Myrmecia] bisecta TaxID=41462 RepID=A0AAW1PPQ2_9CHLO
MPGSKFSHRNSAAAEGNCSCNSLQEAASLPMQSSFVATQQAARPPTNSSSTLHLLDSSMTRIPARAAAWPAAAEPTVAAATEPAVLARQHDYLYYDTDTLSVYMVSPPLGLIEETDEVVPGLLVDYTVDKRIVSVDASQSICQGTVTEC